MSQFSAPVAVKLPLLRVAHPSGEECEAAVQRLRTNLSNNAPAAVDQSDSLQRDVSTKGVPSKTREGNPLLFNFDHYSANDKELTPRSNWQRKVYNLDSQLEHEKERLREVELTSAKKISELEKLVTMFQSQFNEEKTKADAAQQRLDQEERLKEEYNKDAKRAEFNLEKTQQRAQEDREVLNERVKRDQEQNIQLNNQVKAYQSEINQLKEENNKLKLTVVNKDNKNQILEQDNKKEKEMRTSESTQLNRMLDQQQDRAVYAIREAEKNATKVETYQLLAEKAENECKNKDKQIENLHMTIEQLRKEKNQLERLEVRQNEAVSQIVPNQFKDEINNLQVRLNIKDADASKMENLILEMHKKQDDLKQERIDAQMELKQAEKRENQTHSQLQKAVHDSDTNRQLYAQQMEYLEKQVNSKQIECYKQELTIGALQKDRESFVEEIERLNRAKELATSSSIANLPASCLADLSSDSKIREVRESALENALRELKKGDKGNNELLQQIEEMEKKQKRAYLRLYDRVGQEIGTKLHKNIAEHEAQMLAEQEEFNKMTADDMEMDRLRQSKEDNERNKRSGVGKDVTLNDLFRKYNI